ncbi:MAG: recombinase family protein [Candidatus Eisenbacteria sp.]|nr:recombinase family protein [Candidatus Eisenbacteria bacterium]
MRSTRRKTVPLKRPTVRCAIYTRKSTSEGLEQDFNTLDAQREAAEAYIASQKAEGWVALPERYDDGGFSGASMDRPALKRLLAEVEAGKVDCIIIYKVDRLSRSLLDFAKIMERLDAQDTALVAVTQRLDTSTSMGRLTLNMLLSFAQFEREIIAERTRDKVAASRRKGKWGGGYPVLGYDLVPGGGGLVVNEGEATRVRDIFALYAENQSLATTARELDRRGWRTKRWTTHRGDERGGRPFSPNALRVLLTNPVYTGRVRHRDTTHPGEHQAIIEPKVWGRIQTLLCRNGRAGGRCETRHHAMLRGLIWCGACDCKMTPVYVGRNGRRYRYYACQRARQGEWDNCPTKTLPAAELEKFVVEQVRCIGTDRKLLAEVLHRARSEVGRRPRDTIDEQALAAALGNFVPIWGNLSPREQARVIRLLIERVVFDPEAGEVALTFRPSGIDALMEEGAA